MGHEQEHPYLHQRGGSGIALVTTLISDISLLNQESTPVDGTRTGFGRSGTCQLVKMNVDIEELLRLENELKSQREDATSSVCLDAKVNILKYLQVQTVLQYQAGYDALYYELNKEGGLECLRSIAPVRAGDLVQPKSFELQHCDEDDGLDKQLEFFLADASLAKEGLDMLAAKVTQGLEKCKVHCVDVKSLESTRRKAIKFCGGDVRKVVDMARVAVICDTPEALEQVYSKIIGLLQPQDVLRVKNGFNSDWMPGGYRDVKVNPVVNQHLCEIQLQLHDFYTLKSGQHAVYTWARELRVTTGLGAEDMLENLFPEVTKEMVHLARQNWHGTGYYLANLQFAAGEYDLAEKGLKQDLSGAEDKLQGFEDHGSKGWREALLLVDNIRTRLSVVLEKTGKYAEADLLLLRAIENGEKTLGPDHPDIATRLQTRALLLEAQAEYAEADPLYARAIEIWEKAFGPVHPWVAKALNNRAELLRLQGKYAAADPLYLRAIEIGEKTLGPDHPDLATKLNNRASLLQGQGKYAEADPLYLRAIEIGEKTLGPDHPDLATRLNNRAALLSAQDKDADAEPLYARASEIWEKALGAEHPLVATALNNWAVLLCKKGRYAEAGLLYGRCQAIDEKVHGPDHPLMATTLSNRAEILRAQGDYDEALSLNERATKIWMKALGPQHPTVATALNNRAGFFESQGKNAEAEALYERSQVMREKVLGPEHPDVATSLKNRAWVLHAQEKYMEVIPLLERALSILKKLGGSHPATVSTQNFLETARKDARLEFIRSVL
eukprot:g17340.t1